MTLPTSLGLIWYCKELGRPMVNIVSIKKGKNVVVVVVVAVVVVEFEFCTNDMT